MLAEARRKNMATKKKPVDQGPRVVGTVVSMALSKVKPNTWNPNTMDTFTRDSLKQGLSTDGWLSSQALLVWGKDEKGKQQNVIIDGEHRFHVAQELGFVEGPMVFLHGMTEMQAKALTIKMNQKRGKWDEDLLANLVREIQISLPSENLGLELGIQQEALMVMLAEPIVEVDINVDELIAPTGPEGSNAGIPSSNVRMVQLFFDDVTLAEYNESIRRLATKFGTKTVTDTTLEAVRRASGSASHTG
jgi:hypothetical protein